MAANLSLNERRRAWDLPLEGLPPHSRATLEARDALAGADTIVEQADDGCRYVDHGGGHCGPEVALEVVPRGTRLTLIVDSVVVYPNNHYDSSGARTLRGPWRIPFTMP